jgi:DNA-binding XRE family transcriptional regulator
MRTKDLAQLRTTACMTQADVAEALGVRSRTISSWETVDRPFSRIEAHAICGLFMSRVFGPPLTDMCEQAFQAVPSEVVTVWLVKESECILLPEASRKHDLDHDARMDVQSPQATTPLVIESLTTYPLRSGKTLSVAGDAITTHPAKKYKGGRAGHQFRDGRCESVLHVPAFTESARGPKPVLLLSLENKLDEKHKVITAEPGITRIYSRQDEEAAEGLAGQFKMALLPLMDMLDML